MGYSPWAHKEWDSTEQAHEKKKNVFHVIVIKVVFLKMPFFSLHRGRKPLQIFDLYHIPYSNEKWISFKGPATFTQWNILQLLVFCFFFFCIKSILKKSNNLGLLFLCICKVYSPFFSNFVI